MDMTTLRKTQNEIMVRNSRLIEALDDYAKRTHQIDLTKVNGQRKYYDTDDDVDLKKTEE